MASVGSAADAVDDACLAEVERVLTGFDRDYSLYDPASPLSAIARGDLALMGAPERVRDTYALALDWRDRTAGAFTPHRPDGVLDLSGIVKALAMEAAGAVLDGAASSWLLNVGGDVLARGRHGEDPWTIGIVDPDDRAVIGRTVTLTGTRRAVATSGVAERGEHVWTVGRRELAQVTVVAADIVTADVLATAVLAGGAADADRWAREFGVEVVAERVRPRDTVAS